MSEALEASKAATPSTPEEGHVEHEEHEEHPNYVGIAIVLAIVTAVEVAVPQFLDLERSLMVTCLLVLMFLKGAGVALYYMHLRFDSRIFTSLLVWPLVIATAMLIVFLIIFRPILIPG